MVEAEAETLRELGLDLVHLGAVFGHRLAGLGGGQFGGRAVFVGGAEEHHLVPARALVAGIEIGGQLRAHQIAQMLDPVDIGDRRGDQMACHVGPAVPVWCCRRPAFSG